MLSFSEDRCLNTVFLGKLGWSVMHRLCSAVNKQAIINTVTMSILGSENLPCCPFENFPSLDFTLRIKPSC